MLHIHTHTGSHDLWPVLCRSYCVSYSEMITLRSSIPVVFFVSSSLCPLPNCRLSVINTSTHGHTHWPIHLPADLGALNEVYSFLFFLKAYTSEQNEKFLTDFFALALGRSKCLRKLEPWLCCTGSVSKTNKLVRALALAGGHCNQLNYFDLCKNDFLLAITMLISCFVFTSFFN